MSPKAHLFLYHDNSHKHLVYNTLKQPSQSKQAEFSKKKEQNMRFLQNLARLLNTN